MSVQDALFFIQKLGSRSDLQEILRSLGDHVELKNLVDIGSGEGHSFTVKELQIAFVRDWSMRRLFFCGKKINE